MSKLQISIEESYGECKIVAKNKSMHSGEWGAFLRSVQAFLSSFVEPEPPTELEQRYVVVDESAGLDKYIGRWSGGALCHCRHVERDDGIVVAANSQSVAEGLAAQARAERGWHCAVREWPEPEQLYCVKWTCGKVNLPWYKAGSCWESQDTPDPMTYEEAFRLKDRSPGRAILPFPPPEQPVAVKFAVRDKDGEYWGVGSVTHKKPRFFSTRQEAQNVINRRAKSFVRQFRPAVVGFGPDGKEVEINDTRTV